ncbi:hypothetical protein FE257_008212 [Aspergillus nanangensis]|uniref:Uncharacterized protein n=1 Tax=Aspergillus nanangensis TaxID=2582783 RepID=A0AAD4CN79_ASPNN|nr:hypothetical protein FE257_008212 [Aspergillus nanangensis]
MAPIRPAEDIAVLSTMALLLVQKVAVQQRVAGTEDSSISMIRGSGNNGDKRISNAEGIDPQVFAPQLSSNENGILESARKILEGKSFHSLFLGFLGGLECIALAPTV